MNPDVKSAIRVVIINAGDTMLIKTTHDDAQTHFFIGFSDHDDTQQDHNVTAIYYKIWAVNTGNTMLKDLLNKKSVIK